jgi:hypothetical protein
VRSVTVILFMAGALALMVSGCGQPPTLTPDAAVVRTAPTQCGAENSPKRIQEFIEAQVRKETRLIRMSDLIVLGTVSRVAPQLHDEGIRTVVTMSVERCVKGSCADSTRFFVPGAHFGDRTHKLHPALTFRPGDRAVVLLGRADRSAGDDLPELHPEQRYTLDHDGLVVRKGIPIDQFIVELERI